jgi:hypothetical protein
MGAAVIEFACDYCGKMARGSAGHVNRQRKGGFRLFCDRKCAGLGRRKNKTKAERVAEKKIYDAAYREKNRTLLKKKKADWFQRSYDPVIAAEIRKKRMPKHVEYCRRPEYRKYKSNYDRRRRAAIYGPFADAFQLTIDLNREIKSRSSNYEIRQQNQTGQKAQKREREAKQEPRDRRHRHSSPYG